MGLMGVVVAAEEAFVPRQRRAFFSPIFDFLCLGGGSLLLLPIAIWLVPDDFNPRALGIGILLSSLINFPHFAHSYQIFYRTFRPIVSDPIADKALRARYLWAGAGAPAVLALSLAGVLIWSDARALGLAGNVMGFFVGWHYVKQGYGTLMVDAALRRSFFSVADRKVLLVNAYLCWIVSWLAVNKMVADRDLFGLSFASVDFPVGLLWTGAVALTVTSLYTAWTLFQHARAHKGAVPITGIAAYVAALYPWTFMAREPVLGVLIPSMHALQYLVLVWRYQLNLDQAKVDAPAPPGQDPMQSAMTKITSTTRIPSRFLGFVLTGIVLGIFGFWALPWALDAVVPYDHMQYGDYLFFFVLYIFINIHHYFIDNAMWRKENPYTLQHLFSHR